MSNMSCLLWALCQIHIKEMVAKGFGGFLQIGHAKSADGLNDIGFDGTQWHGNLFVSSSG